MHVFIQLLIFSNCLQIEALKAIGVTEVVLAINYQPEVRTSSFSSHHLFTTIDCY